MLSLPARLVIYWGRYNEWNANCCTKNCHIHYVIYKERNVGENPANEKTAVLIGVISSKISVVSSAAF